jgi:hypothetical protein
MEEQLILDFMKFGNRLIHENGVIEDVSTAGEWVMFWERSPCGHYRETHTIKLLEIVAWVYWKQNA